MMRLAPVLLLAACAAAPACPPAPPPAPPPPLALGYRIPTDPIALRPSDIIVYDADTFDVGNERIRVANLDAPEIGRRADCDEERALGDAATAAVSAIIQNANAVTIYPEDERDFFKRVVARIDVDGTDLAQTIIGRGLGRPWRGRSSDWCATSSPAQP